MRAETRFQKARFRRSGHFTNQAPTSQNGACPQFRRSGVVVACRTAIVATLNLRKSQCSSSSVRRTAPGSSCSVGHRCVALVDRLCRQPTSQRTRDGRRCWQPRTSRVPVTPASTEMTDAPEVARCVAADQTVARRGADEFASLRPAAEARPELQHPVTQSLKIGTIAVSAADGAP